MTIPGNPAPDPTSRTCPFLGRKSRTAAEFTRWRDQSRGSSRGPISPRSSPSSTNMLANSAISGYAKPKSSRTSGPGTSSSISSSPEPPARVSTQASSASSMADSSAGRITTRRRGSTPSDSLRRPSEATTSWQTLRSKGFIGSSFCGSPVARRRAMAS